MENYDTFIFLMNINFRQNNQLQNIKTIRRMSNDRECYKNKKFRLPTSCCNLNFTSSNSLFEFLIVYTKTSVLGRFFFLEMKLFTSSFVL